MTGFDAFLWEFIGTALLLLLGNGVCALVNLRTSGARGSDWVVIALGWGMAMNINSTQVAMNSVTAFQPFLGCAGLVKKIPLVSLLAPVTFPASS